MSTITHEEAHRLRTEYIGAWTEGIQLADVQSTAGCELLRGEALAIAERHHRDGDHWAASFWSGYVAKLVRINPGDTSTLAPGESKVRVGFEAPDGRLLGRVTMTLNEIFDPEATPDTTDALATALADVCNACGAYVSGGADPSVMSAHDCDGEEQ